MPNPKDIKRLIIIRISLGKIYSELGLLIKNINSANYENRAPYFR